MRSQIEALLDCSEQKFLNHTLAWYSLADNQTAWAQVGGQIFQAPEVASAPWNEAYYTVIYHLRDYPTRRSPLVL